MGQKTVVLLIELQSIAAWNEQLVPFNVIKHGSIHIPRLELDKLQQLSIATGLS